MSSDRSIKNIPIEFGISTKLVTLIKTRLNKTSNEVHIAYMSKLT
jgi:hypothetical protein